MATELERDVVIIGGGVMGCAVALRLAGRGLRVLVLERSVPGAEASSAAAGMLAPQKEAEGAGALLSLGLASRRLYPALAEELRAATGLDIGYRKSGLLALALEGDEAGWAALAARASWQEQLGLPVERLTRDEVARIEPALAPCLGALRLSEEAQVDPPALMRALQLAAARAGAEFHSALVRRIRERNGRVEAVELDGRVVAARHVVIAAGSWSALIDGGGIEARAVRPVRGQMVELETRPAPFSHLVFSVGGYLVPRADGRITVGSTMEEAGFQKEVTASGLAALLGAATRAVPALGSAPVTRFWSNFRPATIDQLPLVGETAIAGLHLATGHFRNGILLAPITADLLSALICQEPPPEGVDATALSPRRLHL